MTTSDQPESKNQSSVNSGILVFLSSLAGLFLSILILRLSAQPEKPIGFWEGCFFILFSMLLFAVLGWAIFQIVQLISNAMTLFTRYLITVFGLVFSLILPASLAAIGSSFPVIGSSFLGLFAPLLAALTIIARIVKYKFTEKMPGWIEKALDIFIPGAIASGLATLYVFGFQKIFPGIPFINVFNKINLCNLFKP